MKTIGIVNGEEIKALKDGTLMFYDHVHNIGAKFNRIERWSHPKTPDKSPHVTVGDMWAYCDMRSDECKITDFGKSLTIIIPPKDSHQLPITLCQYHSFMVHLTWRYTEHGYQVVDSWHP